MLILPERLPVTAALEDEEITVIGSEKAKHQDIRPLKIVILNLMPDKQTTEIQILRLLSHSILQVEVTFLNTASYVSQNTPSEYLEEFYQNFYQVQKKFFDGLIITGAPLGERSFEEVEYWQELTQIMDWSLTHTRSTLYLCWAAFAGLYHHYGINKRVLPRKLSGVYQHQVSTPHPLTRGFDDVFAVPHSRFASIGQLSLEHTKEVLLLAESAEAGEYLLASRDSRQVFVTGHPEYEVETLRNEWIRDQAKDLEAPFPEHYFPQENPLLQPRCSWRGHGELLYRNWLTEIYLKIASAS